MSSGFPKKTYGRHATVHKEKRKGETITAKESSQGENTVQDRRLKEEKSSNSKKGLLRERRELIREKENAEEATTRDWIKNPSSSPVSLASTSRSLSPSPSRKMSNSNATEPPGCSQSRKRTATWPNSNQDNTSNVQIEPLSSPSALSTVISMHDAKPIAAVQSHEPLIEPLESCLNNCNAPDLSLLSNISRKRTLSQSSTNGQDSQREGSIDSHPLQKFGGSRRMLTKTQSLGLNAPSTPTRHLLGGDMPHESPSGSGTSSLTPSRTFRRMKSLPESPQKLTPKCSTDSDQTVQTVRPPGSSGKAKRTYGKVRTMLVELPGRISQKSTTLIGENENEKSQPQASYAELRQKYEIDNTVNLVKSNSASLMTDLLQAKAPETVSDMRSRGENRRFVDELSYLLEGIADLNSSASFRRSSAIDMLQNMLDETWINKMKGCGQVGRTWECLIGASMDGDDIMEGACLLFLVILLQSDSGLEHVLHSDPERSRSLILRLVNIQDGPLDPLYKLKPASNVLKLRKLSQNIRLNRAATKLTTRRLSAMVIVSICKMMPLAFEERAIATKMLLETTKSLGREVSLVRDRFDWYEKGLDLQTSEHAIDFEHINLCLQIISFIISSLPEQSEEFQISHKSPVQDILDIAIAGCSAVSATPQAGVFDLSQLAKRAIQFLAHLATISPVCASMIIRSEGGTTCLARVMLQRKLFVNRRQSADSMIGSIGTGIDEKIATAESSDLDDISEEELLCFVLALMTTAVLAEKDAAKLVGSVKMQEDCIARRPCLRRCRCASAEFLGHHLSKLYSRYTVHAEDPLSSILRTNLALLLSNLLGETTLIDDSIIDSLPGELREDKLKGLMRSVRELYTLQSMLQDTFKRLLPQGLVTDGDQSMSEAGDEKEESTVISSAIQNIEGLLA
ncbi:hypothetical protein L204_103770 [Cryptococcus depauperatus]